MQITEVLARIPHIEALLDARQMLRVPAWLVGGCVRDLLLDRQPVDVDIATPSSEALARRFSGLVDGRLVLLDAERDTWRVALSAGRYVDFCRFRDTDILGDLLGRDFTINALAVRLPEDGDEPGGLLDPFHGVDDLQAGRLRMVAPQAFADDPARVLRAFRFLAELGCTIAPDTWTALMADADRLPLVAPERLLAEWWKLCAGPYAARAIEQMDVARVLGLLFPEVEATKGVEQNAYHHLDVWEHTLLTVSHMVRSLHAPAEAFEDLQSTFMPLVTDARRRARLVFLALLHDLGKPSTRTVKDERTHFYGHEQSGAAMAAAIAQRFRLSHEDTRAITAVVRHHMRPLFMLQALKSGRLSMKTMINFFDVTGREALDVLALALADKSSSQGAAADPAVRTHLLDLYRTLLVFYRDVYRPAQEHPLLTGHDLTQTLHLPPGPQIGELLHRARLLQMKGELSSHEAALRWAAHRQHA